MKHMLLLAVLTAAAVSPVFAQESADASTPGNPTTATAVSTTSSLTTEGSNDDATTSGAGAGRRTRMSGMDFDRRWERTEQNYKKAGISDEKIQQLKALDKRVFDSLQSGEKVDFAAIREERNQVLDEKEQEKLRSARQSFSGRGAADSQTSAPANQ